MIFPRLAAAVFGAAVFTAGASLALAQQAPSGAAQQQMTPQPLHGGYRHFLTPEQRVMWRIQHRDETKSMSPEQRQSYRQQLRQQVLAMTPEQKAQMRNQLQAQWKQLPPDRQQKIEQRLAQRQQHGFPQSQTGQGKYPSQGSGDPDYGQR